MIMTHSSLAKQVNASTDTNYEKNNVNHTVKSDNNRNESA